MTIKWKYLINSFLENGSQSIGKIFSVGQIEEAAKIKSSISSPYVKCFTFSFLNDFTEVDSIISSIKLTFQPRVHVL